MANESGKRHRRPRADDDDDDDDDDGNNNDDDDVNVNVNVNVEGQRGTNEMPARPTKRAKIANTHRAREEATEEG